MSLNSKLKTARQYLGKNQKEIGELVSVHDRQWQRYETGKSTPGSNVFKALTDLGFNTTWFFTDDESVPMLTKGTTISTPALASQPGLTLPLNTPIPDDNIGLGESVELLAKIYNSGNPVLIRAIAANLHAFSEAVDNKALATKTVNMLDSMNKRMTALEKELAEMRSEEDGRAATTAIGE
jgi:transcriptional regulator with XRE-family HTH domain